MTEEEKRQKKNSYQREYVKRNRDKILLQRKRWREKNKERIAEQRKKYKEKHRDVVNAGKKRYRERHRDYFKKYYKDNKEKLNKQALDRYNNKCKNNPIFKLKNDIRTMIRLSVKNRTNYSFSKDKSTEEILGCTIEEFLIYLESKFKNGMTFENHGQWHIDHIIPLASAKTKEEVYKLCHYTNLQPLWAYENILKSDKIINDKGGE